MDRAGRYVCMYIFARRESCQSHSQVVCVLLWAFCNCSLVPNWEGGRSLQDSAVFVLFLGLFLASCILPMSLLHPNYKIRSAAKHTETGSHRLRLREFDGEDWMTDAIGAISCCLEGVPSSLSRSSQWQPWESNLNGYLTFPTTGDFSPVCIMYCTYSVYNTYVRYGVCMIHTNRS